MGPDLAFVRLERKLKILTTFAAGQTNLAGTDIAYTSLSLIRLGARVSCQFGTGAA